MKEMDRILYQTGWLFVCGVLCLLASMVLFPWAVCRAFAARVRERARRESR